MADGHLNKCKECTKRDVLQHRNEHLDRIRKYDRQRANAPHRLKAKIDFTKKYRQANPLIYQAHVKLNNAVRDGKIQKQPCEICGNPRSEAHHPDYSKPLEVAWLCSVHHKAEHHKN